MIPEFGARPHRYFKSTLSTMTDARAWLAENPPTGAVVFADEQRAGKGRMGRTWLTPPESAIAMSVIIREEWAISVLTMLGAVAVAEVLSDYCDEVNLKWANDVQIGSRKVAGILAESQWGENNHFMGAILGLGVNLTVDFSGTELAESATSLAHHTPSELRRFAIGAAILGRIDHWLNALRIFQASPYQGLAPSPLFLAWQARLSTLGQEVTIYVGDQLIRGRAIGVESNGALILALPDGSQRRFMAGDVSLRRAD